MSSLALNIDMVAQDDQRKAQFDEAISRMSPQQRSQFEARRAMVEANPAAKAAHSRFAQAREQVAALGVVEQALRLEKSWHILHYLFTEHVGPSTAPGDLLLTGDDIGEDVGYGPARLHGEAATRDFSHFLDIQDLVRLQARVNFNEMSRLGLYPLRIRPGSDGENENELLRKEVAFYFPLLRDYVRKMSDKGNGLVVWVS